MPLRGAWAGGAERNSFLPISPSLSSKVGTPTGPPKLQLPRQPQLRPCLWFHSPVSPSPGQRHPSPQGPVSFWKGLPRAHMPS